MADELGPIASNLEAVKPSSQAKRDLGLFERVAQNLSSRGFRLSETHKVALNDGPNGPLVYELRDQGWVRSTATVSWPLSKATVSGKTNGPTIWSDVTFENYMRGFKMTEASQTVGNLMSGFAAVPIYPFTIKRPAIMRVALN